MEAGLCVVMLGLVSLALWLYPLVHRVATLCQHRIVGLAFNVRSYDFVSWLLLAQVIQHEGLSSSA